MGFFDGLKKSLFKEEKDSNYIKEISQTLELSHLKFLH